MPRPVLKTTLVIAAILLAGCQAPEPEMAAKAPPSPYQIAQGPFPPEVTDNLPADVALTDVLVTVDDGPSGPCYFYRSGGKIVPLTTADMVEAGLDGKPYCIM